MLVPPWFSGVLERELCPWLSLSAEQIEKLYQHYELLKRWSKKVNLTSVVPGDEMVIRHYCESLFFGVHLPNPTHSIADIGTGAGFPGVPMAILKPSWTVTLIESNQRKSVFLREATRNFTNVSVVAHRAENLSSKYDWLVSRAVNPREVADLVPRLAPRVGLMLGESDFSELQKDKHIAWSEPIRLPWGDHRICVYGHCSTWNVPRETSE